MFNEYDIVKLKNYLPGQMLPVGTKGTVLMVFDRKPLQKAYEVEFVDEEGKSLAILTVIEDDIEYAVLPK